MFAGRSRRVGRGAKTTMAIALGALLGAPAPGAEAGSGGASTTPPPSITVLECRAQCAGPNEVAPDGAIRVRGSNLGTVRTVVFLGGPGAQDDVSAPARRASDAQLDARVPAAAQSGPLQVLTRDGVASPPSATPLTVGATPIPPRPVAGEPDVSASVLSRKVFLGGRVKAAMSYEVVGSIPQDIEVDLVRARATAPVASWTFRQVAPHVVRTVRWSGMRAGRVQPRGRYEFRIATGPFTAAARRRSRASDAPAAQARVGSFLFLDGIFPVRGQHDFGEAAARFGAGRSGHAHQGQDVLSRCGTRLAAARGGVVQWKAYHAAAGYYLVIDDGSTGVDEVYAHLREPALVARGDRVYTGETIGYVGRTGDATTCHLHFEMWSPPGWYQGGSPFDPLLTLRAWDRAS